MKYPNFKKGAVGSLLALALLTTAVPAPRVEAATLQDLQAQIQTLLAQIQALQAQVPGVGNAGSCTTFTNDMTVGRTGLEVTNLQNFLIGRGYVIPAGATGYFGEQTRSAVAQFQLQNSISPAVGYFGPLTRSKVHALCVVQPPSPTPDTGNNNGGNTDEPANPGSILRGEGDVNTVEIETADDTSIREAASDAPIAQVTLGARNGDVEISRLDISLKADSGNAERDPWDTFEDVSLWADGEKIAEQKIDNRSLFLNRNTGTVRFSNLDLILDEDEEVEITIAASVRGKVKGAGESANWSVSVDSLRYKDADGVVTTDTTTGDLKDQVSFEIAVRGDGEELKFSISSTNPAEQTIIVDEQTRTNNNTLLRYTIEALGNDIELDTLYVNVQTGTAPFDDVVSDIRLKVGNSTFKKGTIITTGDYSTTSVLVAFDINNKIEIDEDEKVTVEVVADLKAKTKYQNGETIIAQVTSAERDRTEAEGADDIESFTGSVVGKVQTLIAEGIFVPVNSVKFKTETLGSNNTIGVFTIEFEVTAVEGDFYITDKASTSSLNAIGGVQYSVDTTAGTPDSVSASLSSTANEDSNGVFTIREGQSETFTLTVTVDAASAGSHRVLLDAVRSSDDSNGITGGTTYSIIPVNEFRTPYQFINN